MRSAGRAPLIAVIVVGATRRELNRVDEKGGGCSGFGLLLLLRLLYMCCVSEKRRGAACWGV